MFNFYYIFLECAGRRLKCTAQGSQSTATQVKQIIELRDTVGAVIAFSRDFTVWPHVSFTFFSHWCGKANSKLYFSNETQTFFILQFSFLQQGDLPPPFTVIHDLISTENKPSSYRHTIEHFSCCSSPQLAAGQWHLFSFIGEATRRQIGRRLPLLKKIGYCIIFH